MSPFSVRPAAGEQVARTIHSGLEPERSGALLPLSCPVLDAELLQTTILAFLRRCADVPAAGPPTLLLLDVDQLAVEGQAELLAFFRVPTFQARALVTARQPLTALAEKMQFSRELACTLSTLVIELPGLAERRQDIPLLAQQLVEEHNCAWRIAAQRFRPRCPGCDCGPPAAGPCRRIGHDRAGGLQERRRPGDQRC